MVADGEQNTGTDIQQNQFSQELQLASASDGPWRWVTGLFYFHENVKTQFNAFGLFTGGRDLAVGNAYRKTNAFAPFAQVDWSLTEQWILTAGMRYTWDRKTSNKVQFPPFVTPFNLTFKANDSEPSGTVRLQYAPNDNVLIYAGYARGFKGSGFNLQPGGEQDFGADPEFVDAYDAGFKSTFANNHVRFNAAAFHYDYNNLQRTRFVQNPIPGGLPILVFGNSGKTVADGFEIDLQAVPVEDLELGITYGYTDAEFKNFITASGNFTGNVPNRTPKNTFVSHIQYTYRGWEAGSLSARLDYTRRGAWFDTDANTLERREPAREVINARLAFESKDNNWGLAAWMKNLTDEQYDTSFTVGIGPGTGRFHAPPRTYGVELTVDF
jgi:iron complex outermembrane receptor protein